MLIGFGLLVMAADPEVKTEFVMCLTTTILSSSNEGKYSERGEKEKLNFQCIK